MSLRVSDNTLYPGSFLVSKWPGLGVPYAEIPQTGESGKSPLANDSLTVGAEYRLTLVTPPNQGTLVFYPDTSFEFSGALDGQYSFTINGYENSVFYGSSTSYLTVAGAEGLYVITTDAATFSGGSTGSTGSSTGVFTLTTESPLTSFLAAGSGASSGLLQLLMDDAEFAGGGFTLIEVWPDAADVRSGVQYGPTGGEYLGTMTEGGGSYPTAEEISQEIIADLQADPLSVDVQSMSGELESGYSIADAIRLLTAVLLGKVQGAGSGTERFRDLSDSKDRVVAVVDPLGNRENIYRDPTV